MTRRLGVALAWACVCGCGGTPEPTARTPEPEPETEVQTANDATSGAGAAEAPDGCAVVPARHAPPTAVVVEELAPRKSLSGNAQIGPSSVDYHHRREVVVVFYQDSLEGEPAPGWICALDGRTETVQVVTGWDYVLSADGDRLVYSADHLVIDENQDPPADRTREVAKAIGVKPADVTKASFRDGFSGSAHVAQPVVIDLDTGAATPLPLVGGGTLALHDDWIVAADRPHYYSFSDGAESDATITPRRLDTGAKKWMSVPDAAEATAALEASLKQEPMRGDPIMHEVIAATVRGTLGLVVVDEGYTVVPARIER